MEKAFLLIPNHSISHPDPPVTLATGFGNDLIQALDAYFEMLTDAQQAIIEEHGMEEIVVQIKPDRLEPAEHYYFVQVYPLEYDTALAGVLERRDVSPLVLVYNRDSILAMNDAHRAYFQSFRDAHPQLMEALNRSRAIHTVRVQMLQAETLASA